MAPTYFSSRFNIMQIAYRKALAGFVAYSLYPALQVSLGGFLHYRTQIDIIYTNI